MEQEFLEDYRKTQRRKIRLAIVYSILAVFIAGIAFSFFKISAGGHFALREAKNVKLACQTLSVEYYGQGKDIYNPLKKNGLTSGVEERLKEVVESKNCSISILEYDTTLRTVKCFVYEAAPYRVTYQCDKDGIEIWSVDYIYPLQRYSD